LRQGTMQELLRPQNTTSLDIDLAQAPDSKLVEQLKCQLQGAARLHWPEWQELDDLAKLLDEIRKVGGEIQAIHYGGQRLEDLFLTLTSRTLRD
jgi:hypothetical protein